MSILLIYPPLTRAPEPPAGIAKLASVLRQNRLTVSLWDANIEGQYFLLNQQNVNQDRWTVQAIRNRKENIKEINHFSGYKTIDHYNRIVRDLNRLLVKNPLAKQGSLLSLTQHLHRSYSPLKSDDLLVFAEQPHMDPFYSFWQPRMIKTLSQEKPEWIGFSLFFLGQAFTTFAMLGWLKKNAPEIKMAVGGGLATSWQKSRYWTDPFHDLVDLWVSEAGEKPLLHAMGHSSIECTKAPDYDELFENTYFAPGRIVPYSTTMGCYWNRCRFCPEQAENNAFTPIPGSQAISEIKALEKYNPVLLHFLDNAIPPSFLKKWVFAGNKIPWYGYVRFDDLLADSDFVHALAESGCVMLLLGLESGDQQVLDQMNKGIDLTIVTKSLENLCKAGISTFVYLLFGTPQEDLNSARKTREFVIKHSECIDFLNLAIFNCPVNSSYAQDLPSNLFYDGDLSMYVEFNHPLGWNRPQIRAFLDKEFKRQPDIARMIRNTPQIFTSNHASFFTKGFRNEKQ